MEHSDQDLVERSLHGHTGSFSALVDRYRRFVFGVCLAYTRDRNVAEDLAQEVFVKAYLRLRDLSDRGRFPAWLRQIAMNECHMWHRHERMVSREEPAATATPASPEADLLARETRQAVFHALGRLTDEQRQVLILHYLESSSLKQIGTFLGISSQAVNQRLYRARRQLKREMVEMVEETIGNQKLPDGFGEEVLSTALARGQALLEEKRWPQARAEFRSILSNLGEHAGAQRGLAEALGREVNDMFADRDEEIDDQLVQEALVAHQEAYRLGAHDSETVWNLAELYETLLRHEDKADLLETHAAETALDPQESHRALQRAGWSCRTIDRERSYSLFRRALSVQGIETVDRLQSYFAAPMKIYFDLGKADVWLDETQGLFRELSPPLTITHYMYYRDRIIMLGWLERFEEAVASGREYLDFLEREPVDDPVQRRWWISDTYGQLICRVYGPMGEDTSLVRTLKEALDNLDGYESEWKSMVSAAEGAEQRDKADRRYRRFLGYAFCNLGCACREAGMCDEAIPLFERCIQQIRDRGVPFMHLAVTHMRKSDRDGALAVLKRLNQSGAAKSKWAFTYFRRTWEDSHDFEAVREDPEFREVVGQICNN